MLSRRQFDNLRRAQGEGVRSGLGATAQNRELARAVAKRLGRSQRSIAASKGFDELKAANAAGGRERLRVFRQLGLDIGPNGEIWYHNREGKGGHDYSRDNDDAA